MSIWPPAPPSKMLYKGLFYKLHNLVLRVIMECLGKAYSKLVLGFDHDLRGEKTKIFCDK